HATVEGQKLERVSQIPAFLRKLELRDPESGEYWSDCMVRSNDLVQDPSGWKRHPHCARNEFKPGEKAIVDPDTGVTVMKQGCHNTGVQKVAKAHCVDDIVYAEEGETVLLDEHGPRSTAQEACTGLKRAGETDFESPWLERCAHPYCSLRVADRYAKYPEQNAGSFYVDQSGWFIVRHPAYVAEKDSDYQYFYCRHRGRSSACAVGIRWFDYLQAKNPQAIGGDERAAVVYPSKEDLDRAGVKTLLGADSALWWDFNRADCPGR
ncbi:MAG: hypothetical protein ACREGR_01670, partial [Minisyncoccia bacterium]